MLCALIMAGGKGERFWPLSTDEKPKQFLNLINEDTMIQMTVKRIEKLIPIERIFVVTAKRYVNLVKEQLPYLPEKNIIIEPVGRNTAPCIALSAFYINKIYPDAILAVLPSDHLIKDVETFIRTIDAANKFIEENKDAIVTLGIKPDRPETGYGYIKFKETKTIIDNFEIKEVEKFVEKPDKQTAQNYIDEGTYLWNAGMFIWKATTILKYTYKFLPQTFEVLSEVAATNEEDFEEVLNEKYPTVDNISVDYAIMEKADKIYVIPSDFGWDDVGTWTSLERYREKDEMGNIVKGNVIYVDSSNNTIISNTKKIILLGLKDCIIVENNDVILISSKEKVNQIKDLKYICVGDKVV
ncbi:mannose-1-phosphate guanylyltransferase (GDP) [Caloramator fervidus]|uniref:mannose-1-phosphate guanylyltransferase n=1 Tax=Caloramator fervidus TaxID=29344 RepID=A0A1H5SZH9_9CLOT|nr:mannose-1-phosphate guanylyltransferase [Caloramator fervidus]SEF55993.1 mannose-1-phosphate guanylyltransferase (GDP) [Caloramator fervidus]